MTDRFLTATALLTLQLPGIPADKGGLSRFIEREGWRLSPLARRAASGRPGPERGGDSWEYHFSLFPAEAQADLIVREAAAEVHAMDGAWDVFEALPESLKATTRERLAVVDQVETLKAGMTASAAVALVAPRAGIAASTLWGWLMLCAGVARPHRLAVLAPKYRGRTATSDCDPRAWDFLAADYLRAERPSFAACHRRLLEATGAHGWTPVPSGKTLERRLKALPAGARALARQGRDAAARIFPHQSRDRSGFNAMQAVNADGHKLDLFVKWEDGTIGRPVLIGVQDLGTGMILGHRLAETENWTAVRLAFADMVSRYGIPEACWLDNGRAFASKLLTGGMKTRFRFKVREDEPSGILTQLGIKVHWTTPYHGQSKPIERAWRDLAEEIAKHPAAAGAYTGNAVDAKPENYGSRAMPIAALRALVASEIARHNARPGRRTATARGISFEQAFSTALAAPGTVVTKATAAQRRLLLLAAEDVTCRKPTGEIQLGGNRYWAAALSGTVISLHAAATRSARLR